MHSLNPYCVPHSGLSTSPIAPRLSLLRAPRGRSTISILQMKRLSLQGV